MILSCKINQQTNKWILTYYFYWIVCSKLDEEFIKKAERFDLNDGTTLLLALLFQDRYSIANVGDSCAYLLKETGEITKLTVD